MYEDIIKLAKKFASTHKQYANVYDSLEDYISELEYSVLTGLNNYNTAKGAFSTWCYAVFGNAVIKEIVSQMRQCRDAEVISLNVLINDDDDTLEDTISDNVYTRENIEEQINNRLIFKKIYPYLSENFKDYYFNDKTLEEIAIKTHTSKQNVNQKLDREREKLRLALEQDNLKLLNRYKHVKSEGVQYDI